MSKPSGTWALRSKESIKVNIKELSVVPSTKQKISIGDGLSAAFSGLVYAGHVVGQIGQMGMMALGGM